MQQYYVEHHLNDENFDKKDFYGVIITITLVLLSAFLFSLKSINNKTKLIEPYYQERFYKVESKKSRFENKNYDYAVSQLLLEDKIRNLKYNLDNLNISLKQAHSQVLKQNAMVEMTLMLRQIKTGNYENFTVEKMQQAVLEAGYGNIDKKLLEKAIADYKEKAKQEDALESRIAEEKRKTQEKISKDSKEATVLAKDIAREIAEEEIEGFIDNLSIIARIGSFVINKVNE